MKRHLAVALLSVMTVSALGAHIAVIDSGTDYKHKLLQGNIWVNPANPQNVVSTDGKTYSNAVYGWNFAENNNQVIDYKYLGTFSQDVYTIFDVQAKILQGTATQSEKDWYAAKKKDTTFLKELSKFGNFVHGTHVSGISAADHDESEVMAVKLIPTEPPGSRLAATAQALGVPRGADNPMALMFLTMLAKRQAELLITVGKFVAGSKAEVANGSFGTSVAAVKPVLGDLLKQITGSAPSEQDKEDYAKFFVSEIAKAAKPFVDASPGTLFVFAAGNDGADNDVMPVSPANIKTDNVITVAATNGTADLAVFSNYGAKMVEVAAPGVAIQSTIPGDQELRMSGTSMAAPYVTNVAALVKDENSALTPKEVKQILMNTVDKKSFLSGKVVSGGIVNRDRAVQAARLSRQLTLGAAIAQAQLDVADAPTVLAVSQRAEGDLLVAPLPSPF